MTLFGKQFTTNGISMTCVVLSLLPPCVLLRIKWCHGNQNPTEQSVSPTVDFGYAWALFSQANDVRQELIAIAEELEAT